MIQNGVKLSSMIAVFCFNNRSKAYVWRHIKVQTTAAWNIFSSSREIVKTLDHSMSCVDAIPVRAVEPDPNLKDKVKKT